MSKILFTIGHSNHEIHHFVNILKHYGINVLCDVRSTPYSRHNPQFNTDNLKKELKNNNIKYVYLGKELGPRTNNKNYYIQGKVQYELLEKSDEFKKGIERLKKGINDYVVVIMCSEQDPIGCHRTILICKNLRNDPIEIQHILYNGNIESHSQLEIRLIDFLNDNTNDLFDPNDNDQIIKAYIKQSQKIAYSIEDNA